MYMCRSPPENKRNCNSFLTTPHTEFRCSENSETSALKMHLVVWIKNEEIKFLSLIVQKNSMKENRSGTPYICTTRIYVCVYIYAYTHAHTNTGSPTLRTYSHYLRCKCWKKLQIHKTFSLINFCYRFVKFRQTNRDNKKTNTNILHISLRTWK